MKIILSLMLTLALILSMGITARSEDGEIPEEWIGEGDTTICVFVGAAGGKNGTIVYVDTNESNLLDALTKAGLISGETVSWGFNVTTVHSIKADYEGKGEYWSIYVFNEAADQFDRLETAIGSTPVAAGDLYLFVLEN